MGEQTKVRVAPWTHASTLDAGWNPARSAPVESVSSSTSYPRTWSPALAAARATDVPINPVPSTAMRSEVVTQRLRAVEVHRRDLALGMGGVEVDEDADDPLHRARHRDLLRAHQRDGPEAHPPRGLGGEHRAEVRGRGEEHADDVGRRDAVALEQRLEQPRRGIEHRRGVVALDADRAADGAHAPWIRTL